MVLDQLIIEFPGCNHKSLRDHKREVLATLTIHGVKVGLTSIGDVGREVRENLELLIENKCEMIICATRTRGETVIAVERHEGEFIIKWLEQNIQPNQEKQAASNKNMSRRIVRSILDLINA